MVWRFQVNLCFGCANKTFHKATLFNLKPTELGTIQTTSELRRVPEETLREQRTLLSGNRWQTAPLTATTGVNTGDPLSHVNFKNPMDKLFRTMLRHQPDHLRNSLCHITGEATSSDGMVLNTPTRRWLLFSFFARRLSSIRTNFPTSVASW